MDLTKLEEKAARMTPDQLTGIYVRLDDQGAALRKEQKLIDAKLEVVSKLLLKKLWDLGQTQFTSRTAGKTVFQSDRNTFRVLDREALTDFILADPENRINLLEARASKDAVENFTVNFNKGELPPGLERNTIVSLNVRKARRK